MTETKANSICQTMQNMYSNREPHYNTIDFELRLQLLKNNMKEFETELEKGSSGEFNLHTAE